MLTEDGPITGRVEGVELKQVIRRRQQARARDHLGIGRAHQNQIGLLLTPLRPRLPAPDDTVDLVGHDADIVYGGLPDEGHARRRPGARAEQGFTTTWIGPPRRALGHRRASSHCQALGHRRRGSVAGEGCGGCGGGCRR